MRIRIPLLSWMFRQALPVNRVFLLVFGVYVLQERFILQDVRPYYPVLLIVAHAWLLTGALGRFGSGSAGFLYTRGYTRNQLWGHMAGASVLSVLAVWLPVALIVWSPLRGMAQDLLFRSPFFPVMAGREALAPVLWLAEYAAILPAFLYARIRAAQPTRGHSAGFYISAMMLLLGYNMLSRYELPAWAGWLEVLCTAGLVILLLMVGFRAHRTIDVGGPARQGEAPWMYLSGRKPGAFAQAIISASAVPPGEACCWAEAVTVAVTGLLMVFMMAYRQGYLVLTVDHAIPEAVLRGGYGIAAIGIVGVLVGATAAIKGWTGPGVALTVVVLISQLFLYNDLGNQHQISSILLSEQENGWIAFGLNNSNVTGAELWVNGVDLGKIPVIMKDTLFIQRVPHWNTPPAGLSKHTDAVRCGYGTWYDPDTSDKVSLADTWFAIPAPDHAPGSTDSTYYARVRVGNEWGCKGDGAPDGDGGGSYSMGNSGSEQSGYITISHTTLDVSFPEREERLRRLLNKARLTNYRVDGEWCKAMDSYGEDGWLVLRKAAIRDPDLLKVMDGWAECRYGLSRVHTADETWNTFQTICKEAESSRSYFSGSPAGRAVEILAPRLDPNRLADRAESLLKVSNIYSEWIVWDLDGKKQFGCTHRIEGFYPRAGNVSVQQNGTFGDRASKSITRDVDRGANSMNIYPVAQALWTLYRDRSYRNSPAGEKLAGQIAAALIRWQFHDENALRIAAALGGPDVDRFLLRSYEQANDGPVPGDDREPRSWFLQILAGLNDAAGRDFRREHAQQYTALAEAQWQAGYFYMNDIFFRDLEDGSDSLAVRYWPLFLAQKINHPDGELKLRWRYLLKMEPLSTVSMYLDAWRSSHGSYYFAISDALGELNELPQAKRTAVLQAVRNEVDLTVANITTGTSPTESKWEIRENVRAMLMGQDKERAYGLMKHLDDPNDDIDPDAVAQWLEHTRPDHPLVEKLAQSSDPELRVLVMGAIKNWTTPSRMALLQNLLHDRNASVRAAAAKTQREIQALTNLPAAALAQG